MIIAVDAVKLILAQNKLRPLKCRIKIITLMFIFNSNDDFDNLLGIILCILTRIIKGCLTFSAFIFILKNTALKYFYDIRQRCR